ncbi:MAG: hypothetical protein K2K95_04475, partial [Muribaculaceae bacterium]|nr:hypothetical protein [Muribaculaceae bacterium]
AKASVAPYYEEFREALRIVKEGGDISATFTKIIQLYKSSCLDKSLYGDFGWMIYYKLKNTSLTDAITRKLLLHQYLKLDLPKPSILHSRILSEAVKLEQNAPLQFRMRDFIRLWGLDNLMGDDWAQFKTEAGHTLPSLVEKLIGVYAKEIKTDGIIAPLEFGNLVDKALERYPLNQNMPYFKAIVLLSQGNKGGAIDYYKQLILRFPQKFYLWSQIAELVDDQDTKIGLLCKALNTGEEDTFLGGVRLRLAHLLIALGKYSNARYELDRYRDTYTAQGWGLKPEFRELLVQVSECQAVDSNKELYSEFCGKAESFIYSALPCVFAVKISDRQLEDRNHKGRKFIEWTLSTASDSIKLKKPNKFGLRRQKNGSFFEIRISNDKIVWIKEYCGIPSNQNWIKVAKGKIKLRNDKNGKSYAILDGAYIEKNLLKNITEGDMVRIIAIRKSDGRWSAVSLKSFGKHN